MQQALLLQAFPHLLSESDPTCAPLGPLPTPPLPHLTDGFVQILYLPVI